GPSSAAGPSTAVRRRTPFARWPIAAPARPTESPIRPGRPREATTRQRTRWWLLLRRSALADDHLVADRDLQPRRPAQRVGHVANRESALEERGKIVDLVPQPYVHPQSLEPRALILPGHGHLEAAQLGPALFRYVVHRHAVAGREGRKEHLRRHGTCVVPSGRGGLVSGHVEVTGTHGAEVSALPHGDDFPHP